MASLEGYGWWAVMQRSNNAECAECAVCTFVAHAIEDFLLINHQTRDLNYCIVMHTKRQNWVIANYLKRWKTIFRIQTDAALNIYWISGAKHYIQAHFQHCMLMHNHDISAWKNRFVLHFPGRSHQFYTPACFATNDQSGRHCVPNTHYSCILVSVYSKMNIISHVEHRTIVQQFSFVEDNAPASHDVISGRNQLDIIIPRKCNVQCAFSTGFKFELNAVMKRTHSHTHIQLCECECLRGARVKNVCHKSM